MAAGVFVAWLYAPVRAPLVARVPGTDRPEVERVAGEAGGDVLKGLVVAGTGRATELPWSGRGFGSGAGWLGGNG